MRRSWLTRKRRRRNRKTKWLAEQTRRGSLSRKGKSAAAWLAAEAG